jgi:predicted dehydrogenase
MKKSPVGIGIIGTGFARTTQIPGFRDCMGAKVVAVASRNPERAEAIAKEFGIEQVAADWQELVRHPDVDLVSIVTPPSTHMEITLAALDHRKAVLCEKPMALDANEARRMAEKAKATGVLALIDHELRFLNSRRVMRGMLQTGAIGSVRHCNYVFRSDYRGIADRAWDWWSDETMGGGALGAIGSHIVDSFRWILSTEVTKVLGMLTTHIKQRPDKSSGGMRPVTTDDEAKLLFRFSDGPHTEAATGAASISVLESGKYENRMEIYGTKGALMVEETGELWRSPTGSGVWRPVQVDQDHMAAGMRESSWSRGFTAFAVAICDAMRFSKTAVKDAATFEDGHRVQVVLDAIRASNESGCWITVNP